MIEHRQTDRAFGLTFAVIFAVICAVGWLVFDAVLVWAAAVSGVFLALALALSWILMPLNRLWSRFAFRLGIVSNYILLGVFFFVFVMPFGFIIRLLGKDPMHRSLKTKTGSYWTPVGRETNSETFHDMF